MTQTPFLLPKLGYTILFTFNGLRFNQKVIENDHQREMGRLPLRKSLQGPHKSSAQVNKEQIRETDYLTRYLT